ncbi:MAG: serine protease [Alphaproteobacteria bacterium]|nr:serine protease [Alphaproteobacteria bacterium]
MRLFVFLFAALSLAACSGVRVETVPSAPFPDSPADAQPSPVNLSRVKFALPHGTTVSSVSTGGLKGILFCNGPYGAQQTGLVTRAFRDVEKESIFTDTLEALGYDISGDPSRMFDEEEDRMRTVYSVGGRITDVKMDLCHRRTFLLGIDQGYTGEAMMEVEWTVFDLLRRRNAYKVTTKGYTRLRSPNYDAIDLILADAFAAAAHNLGADAAFHDLVFYGTPPATTPETILDPNEEFFGRFDPLEDVTLTLLEPSKIPATGRFDAITRAVVMIEAGHGHGSGFFISDEGHILTNAHVVGRANRVRVVTSGKAEKRIAEVVRLDPVRDVALLRLEEPPGPGTVATLPVRLDEPAVGETVYAIGAPRLKRRQDTVTKGIVSARRFDRRENLPFIQADVDIYGGNSGGPLLDENGNVVGISVLGYKVAPDTLGGLNWFIPIEDALKRLDVE